MKYLINQCIKKISLYSILLFLCLMSIHLYIFALDNHEKNKGKKNIEESTKITEEILVVGKAPKERSVSTVTILEYTKIEQIKPLDLSEVIRYSSGVTVSFGEKSVYTLKIRGMDSKRIALLIDGIPVYEPYYSSFDLKTVATGGIDSLKITRGPSSVLYGPNTLGGIVNVITQRPSGKPSLSLNTSYGERNTRSFGLNSGFKLNPFSFTGNLLFQDSDGFYYPDEKNSRLERSNSNYQRFNLNTKIYYNPSSRTEILFNGGIYKSNYGMPHGLSSYKPRYWHFKNWDRYTLNAGGFIAVGEKSLLRFRSFLVKYKNSLDMFKDEEMTERRFESTFDNSVYGFFALGDFPINSYDSLKISTTFKKDIARSQDDVEYPWDEYNQETFSVGIENHLSFSEKWKLVGGVSFDYLDKFIGNNTSKINPLVGIKFSPDENLELHLSFSNKSKFPSMRSMYSSSSGNPDLLSESGNQFELGITYNKRMFFSGSAFLTSFKDMIDSVRLPEYDFQRRYFNINKAHINGFEIQMQKSFSLFDTTINYTYLKHENEKEHRPLDALPEHNLNFNLNIFPLKKVRLGFLGLYASSSSWFDYNSNELLTIPSYFHLDTIISYNFRKLELFLKATNVFNQYVYTEPGFPWRGRYFEFGIKANIFNSQ